jgi:hypothetical protein
MRPSLRPLRRHKTNVLVTVLTLAAVGFLLAVVIITNHLGWTGAAATVGCVLAVLVLAWLYFWPRKAGTATASDAGSGAAQVVTGVLAFLAVILTAIHGISPTSGSSGSAPAKPTTTDCAVSQDHPLLPVLVSNEGPQVQVAELDAAVAGNNTDPRKAQEYLDLYGHLDPLHVPPGDSLYVLGTWDQTTRTFYLQHGTHQRGYAAGTFVRGQVIPDAGGCFHVGIKQWGNPGTFGLSEKFRLVLTSPQQSARLMAAAEYAFKTGNSELPTKDLDTYGTWIAAFEVSTDPYYAQNGSGGWVRVQRLQRRQEAKPWL